MASYRTGLLVLGIFCFLAGIHIVVADEKSDVATTYVGDRKSDDVDQKSDLQALAKNYDYADLSPLADILKRVTEWIISDKKNIIKKAMDMTEEELPADDDIKKGMAFLKKVSDQVEAILRGGDLCQKQGYNMTASTVFDKSLFDKLSDAKGKQLEMLFGPQRTENHADKAREKPMRSPDADADKAREKPMRSPKTAVLLQDVSYDGERCSAVEPEYPSQQLWHKMQSKDMPLPDIIIEGIPFQADDSATLPNMFVGFHKELLCGAKKVPAGQSMILSFKDIMQFVATASPDLKDLGTTNEEGNALFTLLGFADAMGARKGRKKGPMKGKEGKPQTRKAALQRSPIRKAALALRNAAVRNFLSTQVDRSKMNMEGDGLNFESAGLPPGLNFCMYSDSEDVAKVVKKMTAFLNKFFDSLQEGFKKEGEMDWPKTLDRAVKAGKEDKKASCFPAEATVELQGGSVARMDDLKIGDVVKTGVDEYSPVFMFTHQSPGEINRFIALTTESGHRISLTPGHKIYVNDGDLRSASDVLLGDILFLGNGLTSVVTEVQTEFKDGLYNPQTSGDIVVNGVVSSTYTSAIEPTVAHALLAPIRTVGEPLMFAWKLLAAAKTA